MTQFLIRLITSFVISVVTSATAFAGDYILKCAVTTIHGDPISEWSKPLTWMDDGTGPYATGGQTLLDRKQYGIPETLEVNFGATAADPSYRSITVGVKSVERDLYVETSTEGGAPAQLDIYYLKRAIYRVRCAIESKRAP